MNLDIVNCKRLNGSQSKIVVYFNDVLDPTKIMCDNYDAKSKKCLSPNDMGKPCIHDSWRSL